MPSRLAQRRGERADGTQKPMTIRLRRRGSVALWGMRAGALPAPVSTAGWNALADAVARALRAALDLALPRLCAACREPVEGEGLCPSCWSKLSFITRPYCERLGIPFAYDPGPGILSMEAIADPPAYNRARAAVRFDEISRAWCMPSNMATGSTSRR